MAGTAVSKRWLVPFMVSSGVSFYYEDTGANVWLLIGNSRSVTVVTKCLWSRYA